MIGLRLVLYFGLYEISVVILPSVTLIILPLRIYRYASLGFHLYLAVGLIYPSVGLLYHTSAVTSFCPYRRFIITGASVITGDL